MFSSSQRSKRKRGVILSLGGWERLRSAQIEAEKADNEGFPYTLEELNEITGLSSHTLTKVRRRQKPVDKQTLDDFFKAFNLSLTTADYTKPISETKSTYELAVSTQHSASANLAPGFKTNNLQLEPLLPEGQVSLNSPFYVDRSSVETNCYKNLLQPGSLIRIKAPRRMGKSSLMVRTLNHAAQQGYQTVFLSMQMADRSILQDLDRFLRWFSASVGLGMHLPNRLSGYWDELFGSKISCKIYFEEYLLAQATRPVVLALDDVDLLFDYPELADEFFGLLRTWHEQAKNSSIWQKLRLIVAHSTQVYIPLKSFNNLNGGSPHNGFSLNVNKSPFNVGFPVELSSFVTEQIQQLAERYNLNLSAEQIKQLMDISDGQPYLVQLGLYSLWEQNNSISPQELLRQATQGRGIYADHLQRLLWTLKKDPQLAAAYSQVVQTSNPIELELPQAFKLESLGLVRLQKNQAVSSCSLYTEYFSDRLDNY